MTIFMLQMIGLGILAGILGSILGIGGGILMTPALTLLFNIDIKYAIGASIISVIATSSGATIAYLKDDLLNLRVAMFLEIFTTLGAIIGAILTGLFAPTVLYFLFGGLLLFSTYSMFKKISQSNEAVNNAQSDKLATKLKLNSHYYDPQQQKTIDYQVQSVPAGSSVMFGAGLASGLLGIGSGVFKVMAMDTFMKMPLKPSTATSNLMMGVTAAASATVYFFNGQIQPGIAAPLAIGILAGALIGTRIMPKMPSKWIRIIFIPVLLYVGVQMLLKGIGVSI